MRVGIVKQLILGGKHSKGGECRTGFIRSRCFLSLLYFLSFFSVSISDNYFPFVFIFTSKKKKADRYGFWHALPPAILVKREKKKKSLAKLQVVFTCP